MLDLLVLFIGVLILLLLIIKFKLNTFVSLIIVSVLVGLGLGMPLGQKFLFPFKTGLEVLSVSLRLYLVLVRCLGDLLLMQEGPTV